jgi:hypothetical protein
MLQHSKRRDVPAGYVASCGCHCLSPVQQFKKPMSNPSGLAVADNDKFGRIPWTSDN